MEDIDKAIKDLIVELKALSEMKNDWQRSDLMIRLAWSLLDALNERMLMVGKTEIEH